MSNEYNGYTVKRIKSYFSPSRNVLVFLEVRNSVGELVAHAASFEEAYAGIDRRVKQHEMFKTWKLWDYTG